MTPPRFAAFAALYAGQQPALWAYLVRTGAAAALAEDLAQEAFIKWLDHAQAPEDPGAAKAFLFTTATRLLIDRWRRERRYVAWDDSTPANTTAPPADGLLSSGPWTALTPRERQLLWLAHAEEFTHAEIAQVTGLAPASVKVLLSRARQRLKARLMPTEQPDD